MTTKKGIKLYINGIQEKINETFRSETLYMKDLQRELKRLKKRKSLASSEKLRVKFLSVETKKSRAIIRELKKRKKELTFETVSNDLEKLRKHPHIVGIEAEAEKFYIYTKPLKVSGRKIGYYQIELPYKYSTSIYIYNLYKRSANGVYDHWFIEKGRPCFGSWGRVLRGYLCTGNIYLGIDTIIQFLTSGSRSQEGYISFKDFIHNY